MKNSTNAFVFIRNSKGFTLAEAMAAVGLTSILVLAGFQVISTIMTRDKELQRQAEFQDLVQIMAATMQDSTTCSKNLSGNKLSPTATDVTGGQIDSYTGGTKAGTLISTQNPNNHFGSLVIQKIQLTQTGDLASPRAAANLTIVAASPDGTKTYQRSLPILSQVDASNGITRCVSALGSIGQPGAASTICPDGTPDAGAGCKPNYLTCYKQTPTVAVCPSGSTPAPHNLYGLSDGGAGTTMPCDCDQIPGTPQPADSQSAGYSNIGDMNNSGAVATPSFDSGTNSCQCSYNTNWTNPVYWQAVICCIGPQTANSQ